MTTKTNPARGYLYIATATFLWGVAAALGRAAFTGKLFSGGALPPIDPLIISQARVSFTFLMLLPTLLLMRGHRAVAIPTSEAGRIFLLGLLGIVPSNYFYYLAIQRTNVATAIIVQYTAPVWVLLYMVARGRQRASLQRIGGVALALTGITFAIGGFSPGGFKADTIGVAAALTAALSFAFYNIGGHDILARHDHWIVMLYATLAASLFWQVINPPWKLIAMHYDATQWLFLAVFALVSMLAPFAFYFAGLRHLEPTKAIVMSCLEPVFSILIAAVALSEKVNGGQILGIVLVIGAIVLVQMPDRKNPVMPPDPVN